MSRKAPLLFLTALIIATAGLVYELVAGTLASYVLGDSVTQFSTVIGAYMSAMGLGAYLSQHIRRRLSQRFVQVELAAALVGGSSAPLLFLAFAHADFFGVALYGTVLAIGAMVGLELPLLMRILKDDLDFEGLVAKVLTFDYVGALIGSLLFAIFLVPELGLVRTSLLFGLMNCGVALMSTWVLRDHIWHIPRRRLRVQGALLAAALLAAFVGADRLTRLAEAGMYGEPVVFAEQTPYQRIVMTRGAGGEQLYLNGNLQFSSADEYRYHEALVHPAFAAAAQRGRVLVLGGGDGLAVREILRYPAVREITLVDLDAAVTRLARSAPALRALNGGALDDPRVTLIHDDAMVWLDRAAHQPYDVLIVDFPDPNNFSLGKLYTSWFYTLLQRAMHPHSVVAVQSTSPLLARRSFWCVVKTMQAAGLHTQPYHATVPSFGEWGYVLASPSPLGRPEELAVGGLRYLNDATLASLFVFSEDMTPLPVEENRLDSQRLVRYYEREWSLWN